MQICLCCLDIPEERKDGSQHRPVPAGEGRRPGEDEGEPAQAVQGPGAGRHDRGQGRGVDEGVRNDGSGEDMRGDPGEG